MWPQSNSNCLHFLQGFQASQEWMWKNKPTGSKSLFYLSDFALEIIFATQNIFRPLRFMISFLPPFWVKFGSNHITRFSHHGILGAYGFIEPKFYEVVIEREKKTCKKGGGPMSFGPNGKGGFGGGGGLELIIVNFIIYKSKSQIASPLDKSKMVGKILPAISSLLKITMYALYLSKLLTYAAKKETY